MRPAWYPRVHAPRVTWTCPREALARACGVAEFGASLQCFVHRYYEEPPRFETFDERAAYEQASGNVDMCEKLEMILVHPEHGKSAGRLFGRRCVQATLNSCPICAGLQTYSFCFHTTPRGDEGEEEAE